MNRSISISRKIALAYSEVCKPLCKELGLPQTAFDILMFLGNNPAYKTASEIVEIRRLKANLVSVNVEKLVQEGYLTRCAVAGDRRKTELLCTEKAAPILARGRQLQKDFSGSLFAGMDEARREAFAAALAEIESNLDCRDGLSAACVKMRPFDGHFDFLRHHKTSCLPSFPIGRQEVFPFAENKKNLTSEEVRFWWRLLDSNQ